MSKQSHRKSQKDYTYWGIALGSVFGIALTISFKDPVYFIVGIIFGIAIGYALDQNKKREE